MLLAQLGSMQDQLYQLTGEVQEVRQEVDVLHAEAAAISSQRGREIGSGRRRSGDLS
jgi:hypothetical protein